MTYFPKILYLLLFIASLFNTKELLAQSFSTKMRKLSIENGLSNRFSNCVFKDYKGLIWIGTRYGLNRYDGYNFDLFTQEKLGLVSNNIQAIYEDGDHCLWLTFFDANNKPLYEISVLDPNTNKVQRLSKKLGSNSPFKEEDILELHQAGKQSILIVTKDNSVYQYNSQNQYKKLFQLPYSTHTINSIKVSPKIIWLFGDGYLLEYNKEKQTLQEEKLPFKTVWDTWLNADDEIYGYSSFANDSLFFFSKKADQTLAYKSTFSLPKDNYLLYNHYNSSYTSRVRHISNNLIWYNNNSVAQLYNTQGELLFDYSTQIFSKDYYSIKDVFVDDNYFWVSTTNGIFIIALQPSPFKSYLNQDEFIPNSKMHSTRGILEHDSFLYVNSYSGRKLIDLRTGKVNTLAPFGSEIGAMRDKSGNFWFCGENNNVDCYNPQLKSLKNFKTKTGKDFPLGYRPSNYCLYQDNYSRIWMGTKEGVYYLDSVHQSFIKFNAYGSCAELNSSEVYAFVEDPTHKILWVASSSGVYKYEYSSSRFTRQYAPSQKGEYHIPHAYIYSMHRDSQEDCYWLGTNKGGLIKWIPQNGTYKHFTVETGLSDNIIYSILEDDKNCLWLGSNYGLMQFEKTTQWVTTYLPKDGLCNEEFNTFSAYKSVSGQLYFGGTNGIVSFNPNNFGEVGSSKTPICVLKYEYLKGNAQILEDRTAQFIETPKITLEPHDNFFRLTFSLLDFRDPSRNKYSYKIEGSEEGWQYISENVLRINRLPYGNYNLIIRGQGFDGRWSDNQLSIPIEIQVSFYQTNFFIVGIIIATILLSLLIIRIILWQNSENKKKLKREVANQTQMLLEREQDLLKAKQEAEKSSKAKAEFLSVMSHEIRTPMNAVVNLTNYLLEDTPATRQLENLNVLKFSANNLLAIINDVLDFNKIESGKVELEQIDFDLNDLLASIHHTMAISAKNKNIDFLLEKDLNLSKMLVGDPNRLNQILTNLISNAIKFTEKGYVKLKLSISSESESSIQLLFEVVDTGIGIESQKKDYIFDMFTQAASDTTRKYGGTGLGLAITKRLLQLQNSEIKVESTINQGSTFYFELYFPKGARLQEKYIVDTPTTITKKKLEGAKILIVEDNLVNLLVLKKFLKKWGVDFDHANDGEEAVSKSNEFLFDLILMDIHMPNMDGYMATQLIRALPNKHYEKIPIIALTASALTDNKDRIFEVGMNDIIVKPFNPDELYKMIVKYLTITEQ